jgi:HEAT repeat protein
VNGMKRVVALGVASLLMTPGLVRAQSRSTDDLIRDLNDSRQEKQIDVLRALAKRGPGAEKAVHPIIPLLKDNDAPVRKEAAYTLGAIGSAARPAANALADAMNDKSGDVRFNAAKALRLIGSDSGNTVSALTAGLRDPEAGVRYQSARALRDIGAPNGKSALPALEGAKNDGDSEVKDMVDKAIARIAGRPEPKGAAHSRYDN